MVWQLALVPLPGAMGAAAEGLGENPAVVIEQGVLPVVETLVNAIEPELTTDTTSVPVPDPPGTARDALTWIWSVFCARLAVVVKYV